MFDTLSQACEEVWVFDKGADTAVIVRELLVALLQSTIKFDDVCILGPTSVLRQPHVADLLGAQTD